ncbi:P-loop NTPase fold protein [Sulfuricurvum sp.]|uniref:P-loop NTPase fold protein n=1 Tax=Sulfuricurvum sp. TaxID=2025608 RepID=UPI003C4BD2FD
MSNVEKLKKYLIGDNDDGYLLKEISNGKVIMLSGEWGSGKTHFWKNEIEPKFQKKPYAYVSLYGKTSISSIENDLYMQIYGNTNNEGDFISKASSTLISTYARVLKPISIIDAGESEKAVLASKHKKAIEALNQNALICFDDFERKSKEIDLNDLFGFITQLALNFNCKVILILNSDVFDGKEKEVFINVKEKTVSKYLKFTPTSTELFEIIFNKNTLDEKYKTIILDAINEFGLLNARIYENILGNLQEYVEKNRETTDQEIRYFVLTLINFNLYHVVFKFYGYSDKTFENSLKFPTFFVEQKDFYVRLINAVSHERFKTKDRFKVRIDMLEFLTSFVSNEYKSTNRSGENAETKPTEKLTDDLKIVNKYADVIWSYWRLEIKLEYRKNIDEKSIRQINDFIETGIL